MTSWKHKARLLLLVFLSMIDLSYGGCADYLKVEEWKGNLTHVFTLVETDDWKDVAECTLEKEAVENNDDAWYILRDCFKTENRSDIPSKKCKRNTSGTIPFYNLMCLTIAAFNRNNPERKIEDKHCKYDTTCRLHSGEPSTATPTTLPERTVVTPTWTTTELPPTTTNFTQITGLNRSTTLLLTTTQPKRTTSATRLVTPTMTETPPEVTPPTPPTDLVKAGKRLGNEKENLALKIFSVISAALNMAALMVFLYQRKKNRGLSHKPVATYMSDGASLEAQRMTEPPEADSIYTHSLPTPNGCRVGNEE